MVLSHLAGDTLYIAGSTSIGFLGIPIHTFADMNAWIASGINPSLSFHTNQSLLLGRIFHIYRGNRIHNPDGLFTYKPVQNAFRNLMLINPPPTGIAKVTQGKLNTPLVDLGVNGRCILTKSDKMLLMGNFQSPFKLGIFGLEHFLQNSLEDLLGFFVGGIQTDIQLLLVPDVIKALAIVGLRMGKDHSIGYMDYPTRTLLRIHPIAHFQDTELEHPQVHHVALEVTNLYSVSHIERFPPKDKQPTRQIHENILQGNGYTC